MIREVAGHGAFLAAGGRAEDGKPSQPKEKVAENAQQSAVEQAAHPSVEPASSQAPETVQALGHELRYEVDEDLNKVVIKILEGESGKLVRQIPAEEVMRLARFLEENTGPLLDRRV